MPSLRTHLVVRIWFDSFLVRPFTRINPRCCRDGKQLFTLDRPYRQWEFTQVLGEIVRFFHMPFIQFKIPVEGCV